MKDSLLVQFIRESLTEAKIRETEITGGKKVKRGSREHKADLKRRIKDLEWARNKYKRGTEKRANYNRVLSHLKRELRSVESS